MRTLPLGVHVAVALVLATIEFAAGTQDVSPRDAAAAKIGASIAERKFDQALAAYDAYVSAAKKPDVELLRPLARAELEQASQSTDRQLAADALERLARAGDAAALSALKRAAGDPSLSPDALAPTISLARLGDKESLARLGAQLQASSAQTKVQMIQVLQAAKATAQAPAIAALLGDAAPNVRAAAVIAVGSLQYRDAVPKLKQMFESDVATVKLLAGVALTRFGDKTAEPAVAELLKSEIPEARLMAGEALQASKTVQWMPLVKALRNDPNPVYQVRAAQVVACCDPAWSKSVLTEALSKDMALHRLEAARALDETDLADATSARRMLGDASQVIRTYGAGAVLRLAAKPAPSGRGRQHDENNR